MTTKTRGVEWVSLFTMAAHNGMFYEEGGIYDHKPVCAWTQGGRKLDAGEPVAACPRCGQRFANTEDGDAESHRDLHLDGDEDCPSICKEFPDRKEGLLRVVKNNG
jgi:hypothetical protein